MGLAEGARIAYYLEGQRDLAEIVRIKRWFRWGALERDEEPYHADNPTYQYA